MSEYLIHNAKIFTSDGRNPFAQAALVRDGRFAWVGAEEEYTPRVSPETEIRDMGGKFVMPGFNDSHMHYLHYVKRKMSVDLSGSKSICEIVSRMKDAAGTFDPASGMFLVGEGWNQDKFTEGEVRFPTADDLDGISEDIPVIVMRVCYHVGVLNHRAMEAVGLDAEKAKELGNLCDTGEDGEPNGIIRENYFDDVKANLPYPSLPRLFDMAMKAQEDFFRVGITSVQTDDYKYSPEGGAWEYYRMLRHASETGTLKLRYAEQLLCDDERDIRIMAEEYPESFRCEHFRISAVKILSDGSLGARSAFLKKPYADDPQSRGMPLYAQKELDRMVVTANRLGLPCVIHAIGNGAAEMCLHAFRKGLKKSGRALRNGIVHCQITTKKQIREFRELGLSALTQPIFLDYDMHIVNERVGKKLAKTSYNWKRYMDLGVHESFGTDAPVERINPLCGIYCAVTRCDLEGNGPYLGKQAVPVADALRAYTAEGAYQTYEETYKGLIATGYLADYIVLDRDLTAVPPEEILNAEVLETYIDGNPVYMKKGL